MHCRWALKLIAERIDCPSTHINSFRQFVAAQQQATQEPDAALQGEEQHDLADQTSLGGG